MFKRLPLYIIFTFLSFPAWNIIGEKEEGETTDPVNPEPSWFGATVWHPDGNYIAYNHFNPDVDENMNPYGLHLLNLETGENNPWCWKARPLIPTGTPTDSGWLSTAEASLKSGPIEQGYHK